HPSLPLSLPPSPSHSLSLSLSSFPLSHPSRYLIALSLSLIPLPPSPPLSLGDGPGPRYVLLHEAAGGDRDLPGPWQWLRTEGRNLSLQDDHPAPTEKLQIVLAKVKEFHQSFTQRYS
ncbi:hypothetical protein ANANG_G00319870, partial [Anguilla anguilla]